MTEPKNKPDREVDIYAALLAHGSDPCIYCGLAKQDMAKCALGFPGCNRADDMLLFDDPWHNVKKAGGLV